jgi:hypothetical protein
MSFENLLKRAKKDGFFNPEEESDLEQFRHLRNAYAHFREPLHKLSSVRRSIKDDLPFEDLLWTKIVLNSVVWVRFPHMMLAAYLTGEFCVAANGAWYLLRNEFHAEAHIMLRMGLFLAP